VPEEITLQGKVVWVKDRSVGIKLGKSLPRSALMRFRGGPASESKRRRLPRIEVAAPARLRSRTQTYSAEVVDVSPSGAMVRSSSPLPGAGPIVLDVLGLPRLAGQVRWTEGNRAGILFNTPLALQTLTEWIQGLCPELEIVEASPSDQGEVCTGRDASTSLAS
jgi:hypothetical protein